MFIYKDMGFQEGEETNVVVHPLAQYEDSLDNLRDLLGIDLDNPENANQPGFFNLEGESSSPMKNGKQLVSKGG